MTATLTPPDLAALTADLMTRVAALCEHTEVPGTIQRTFLSPAAAAMHADLSAWATTLGLDVRVDEAGNWRAALPAAQPDAPTFLIGSHLDTVPDGGRYDGLLGVTMGVALAGALRAAGAILPYRLEVLGFTEEEGVRFGVPFIGSLSTLGQAADLLDLTDAAGVSVRQAMRDFGLDDARLPNAALTGEHLGFLEFHIEQGPVLEAAGQPLGVVSALVGHHRAKVTFTGRANHAGTTPMHLRHDALTAAAEWMLEAERTAQDTPGLVATVGRVQAFPGASNVIPGRAELTLDLRHADDTLRARKLADLHAALERIGAARGVQVSLDVLTVIPAVPLDDALRAALHRAAHAAGLDAPELVSGAGHDAMIVARAMPAAMLFLRTPGGLSHHPDETVSGQDVQAALQVAWHFLLNLPRRGA
ncbi:allantoate amidohydrolase [Deinococcus aquiradiocola]|uniref:Zn-dependent hydrolase n=1 Tax=Deinococcus aquiradiocola TaxID=393059 RepID=A0A917URT2_9DEIO|nr:allantoate amidohydrolase [Deinococcus aquiradiocola]GGJ80333.1 Zn-dependent hydrolase [Deinococcus aquiradiocola]